MESKDIPSVTLADEERVQELLADAKGKVLVVNVWATWCLPCVAETPLLSSFYRGTDSGKVAFISLSVDRADTIDDLVRPFVKDRHVAFPVNILNFKDPDPTILAGMLGVASTGWDGTLPATFVFDRGRTLQEFWLEGLKPGALETAVGTLLASASRTGTIQPKKR